MHGEECAFSRGSESLVHVSWGHVVFKALVLPPSLLSESPVHSRVWEPKSSAIISWLPTSLFILTNSIYSYRICCEVIYIYDSYYCC